jgi:protein-disulfide isomerase
MATTAQPGAKIAPARARWLVPVLSASVVALGAALFMAHSHADRGSAAEPPHPPPAPASAASVASAAPALPAPATAERSSLQVDHDDSTTVWRIPIGDSPQRGPADALVTVVEFGNFQCPFSKGIERGLREILDEYRGKVRLVWKDDPLAIHSQAEAAAQLAREARALKGEEGFWAAHDALIDPGFKPTIPALIDVAKGLHLDPVNIAKAMEQRRHLEVIARDADLADSFVIYGTPYFFVNGRRVRATVTLDKLKAAIARELKRVESDLHAGKAGAGSYDLLVAGGRGPLPLDVRSFSYHSTTTPSRGSETARVFLLEFCEFEEFMCRLVDPTIDRLLKRFPELGASWIDMPNSKSAISRRASIAVRVAWREKGVDGFDKMRRLLLDGGRQPGGLSAHAVSEYARQLGFEDADFSRALEDPSIYGEIESDAASARAAGIAQPPAFLVCAEDMCLHGGYFLSGVHPERAFEQRIRMILQGQVPKQKD